MLYLVYLDLLRISLGKSVGVFFLLARHCGVVDYYQAVQMFFVFTQISV